MAVTSMLAVNIGNTVTKIGLYQHDTLVSKWTVTTPATITVSEVQTILMNFFASLQREQKRGQHLKKNQHQDGSENQSFVSENTKTSDVSAGEADFEQLNIQGSIIASVAPPITKAWVSALTMDCGRTPLQVGPGLKTGIRLGYSDPSELGADRIAEMIGARDLFGSPLVVVNLETTTTFEVIDKNGEFVGGIIAPGLESSAKGLSAAAAKLPVVDLKAPTTVIGKSTRAAMQSGVVLGEVARIDGLVSYIWQELGYKTKVIAAGADAKLIKVLSQTVTDTVDNLTLHGLKVLFDRNTK